MNLEDFKPAVRLLKLLNYPLKGGVVPNNTPVGTGFFVVKGNTDGYNYKVFLVSNRHVFQGEKQLWFCPPTKPKTNTWLNLNFGPGSQYKVVNHTNPKIDLAAIDVTARYRELRANPNFILALEPFPYEMLLTTNELLAVPSGIDVDWLGFPNGVSDDNNQPLHKSKNLSTSGSSTWNGLPHLVIDGTAMPGASGSPAFVEYGGRIRLLGVITQTILATNEYDIEDNDGRYIGKQSVTLTNGAHIVKSSCLRELIDTLG